MTDIPRAGQPNRREILRRFFMNRIRELMEVKNRGVNDNVIFESVLRTNVELAQYFGVDVSVIKGFTSQSHSPLIFAPSRDTRGPVAVTDNE